MDGRIISLSLPVRLVFECIWRPAMARGRRSAAAAAQPAVATARGEVEVIGPPMVVTYRLQVRS